MNAPRNYIVATIKRWNIASFNAHKEALPESWTLVSSPEHLLSAVNDLKPRYVFFPHWSWKVPASVLQSSECVGFHMGDLPEGRGGSPLQNLILAGKKKTFLNALRMVDEMDAGPIYLKKEISLGGAAQKIYEYSADLSYEMIKWIVANEPEPKPQVGSPTFFKRRTPEQSLIPESISIEKAYDFIRMLDAEGYPPAFIDHGDCCVELTGAILDDDGNVSATAKIKRKEV